MPPIGTDLRHEWITSILTYTEEEPKFSYNLICELQFEPSLIKKRADRSILSKNAVPTIFPNINMPVYSLNSSHLSQSQTSQISTATNTTVADKQCVPSSCANTNGANLTVIVKGTPQSTVIVSKSEIPIRNVAAKVSSTNSNIIEIEKTISSDTSKSRANNNHSAVQTRVSTSIAPSAVNDEGSIQLAKSTGHNILVNRQLVAGVPETITTSKIPILKRANNIQSTRNPQPLTNFQQQTLRNTQLSSLSQQIHDLTKKWLDLDIETIKAKDRIRYLETKLEKKTDDLNAARKESKRYKLEVEKLNSLPQIRSESLNVSHIFSYFSLALEGID